jgi:hypothetical protein
VLDAAAPCDGVRKGELDLEYGKVAVGQGATEPHRGQATREVLFDGDRVVAADDAFARLRPLLHKVVVQAAAGGFPIAGLERPPELLGYLTGVPLVHVDPPPSSGSTAIGGA